MIMRIQDPDLNKFSLALTQSDRYFYRKEKYNFGQRNGYKIAFFCVIVLAASIFFYHSGFIEAMVAIPFFVISVLTAVTCAIMRADRRKNKTTSAHKKARENVIGRFPREFAEYRKMKLILEDPE